MQLETPIFTWRNALIGGVAALLMGTLWITQPDVSLESKSSVTLKAGHGRYYEARADGTIAFTPGPIRATHLFTRIVKRRGLRTYIYLESHFGTYLQLNPETGAFDVMGTPSAFGSFELDPSLLFSEWRSGRITHPLHKKKTSPGTNRQAASGPQKDGSSRVSMVVGESPDAGIWEGNAVVQSQADLQRLFGYRQVTGDVRVVSTKLRNLDALVTLRAIGGSLVVEGNHSLESSHGLRGLESVAGNVVFNRNSHLSEIKGLRNLSSIGGSLGVKDNQRLKNLQGLQGISSHGGFELANNPSMSKCAEDLLLEQSSFEKDKVELFSHRVSREGWRGEYACAQGMQTSPEIAAQVFERAQKVLQAALARLDVQLERAFEEERVQTAKRKPSPKAAAAQLNSLRKKAPRVGFQPPSFGPDKGATGFINKRHASVSSGTCKLGVKVASQEERRRLCKKKRREWESRLRKPAYVYILQSQVEPAMRHVEWGVNPTLRETLHSAGKISKTADHAPWKLVYSRKLSSGFRARAIVRDLQKRVDDTLVKLRRLRKTQNEMESHVRDPLLVARGDSLER